MEISPARSPLENWGAAFPLASCIGVGAFLLFLGIKRLTRDHLVAEDYSQAALAGLVVGLIAEVATIVQMTKGVTP